MPVSFLFYYTPYLPYVKLVDYTSRIHSPLVFSQDSGKVGNLWYSHRHAGVERALTGKTSPGSDTHLRLYLDTTVSLSH